MSDKSHLEKRIAQAAARAAVSGRPSVVTVAARADGADPLAVALGSDPPFAYWEMPDRGFSFAALGEAHRIVPGPETNRFRSASAALRDLVTRTHQVSLDGAERTPMLVGGFSFHPEGGWPGFPAGRLALPELALIQRDRGSVWVAATEITDADDPETRADALIERIEKARTNHIPRITPKVFDRPETGNVDLTDPAFLDVAAVAIRQVRSGTLRKVVLARQVELDHRPDLGPFLAALRQIHHTCAVFAFGREGGSVFCGATPELLARVDGVGVSTLALAGTAPRGSSPTDDDLLADRLRSDPKELEEHEYVHSEVLRRLDEEGFVVAPPAPTEVMKLAGIQHLATRVTAIAPVGTNVLDVVGALHPTPAVAGLPRDRAVEWIEEHEPLDRGWYAGPIGYCDLAGNGEFHVAIRSCLIDGKRTRLFAGSGIVGTSSPERELKETDLKLGAILPSLFGMQDHRWRTYATADTLLASLRSGGVESVVISPGSRSTPLVVAAASERPPSHVVLDERSAGFVALGMAKASGRPAALICTSGSAAANYLPAVVEADRARVPLVVLTADRPPGFLDRDAPQTIDQVGLYGSHIRAAVNLPVAHECNPRQVVQEAIRAIRAAEPPNAGPVHVNVPFAKPLEPPTLRELQVDLPVPGSVPRQTGGAGAASVEALGNFIGRSGRGVIVVGPRSTDPAERGAIAGLGSASGWPILADGMSGLRVLEHQNLLTTGDLLLRDTSFVAAHRPDAVVRIGATPTGSTTQGWLESLDVPVAVLDPDFRWSAPGPELVLRDPIDPLLELVSPRPLGPGWSASWRAAEERVRRRRAVERSQHADTELSVTAAVLESEPVVWTASSMPVRHVDAMMEPGCGALVLGNRGACGIDGTIASATGAALALGRRVTALVGDLAFLHDVGSLAAARRLEVDLSIVVLDNGGGAIFEALPYLRSLREAGDEKAYAKGRELFVTPHSQDLVAVAAGFGVPAERVRPEKLPAALAGGHSRAGICVFVVETDPAAMFAAYDRLAGRWDRPRRRSETADPAQPLKPAIRSCFRSESSGLSDTW